MFNITPQVKWFLELKPRKLDNILSIEEVKERLRSKEFPLDHPIVEFQSKFAGYYIGGGDDFSYHLGVRNDTCIFKEGADSVCEIGREETHADTYYYIDQKGRFYFERKGTKYQLNTTFQTFIQCDSFREWISRNFIRVNELIYFACIKILDEDLKVSANILSSAGYINILEASDEFITYWFDTNYLIKSCKLYPWRDHTFTTLYIWTLTKVKMDEILKLLTSLIIEQSEIEEMHPLLEVLEEDDED